MHAAALHCTASSKLMQPPHRLPIGGRVVSLEHAAKSSQPAPPLLGATTDIDHYGGRRVSTELTPEFFPTFVREHDAVLVNYHAPWCPHCQVRLSLRAMRAARFELRAASCEMGGASCEMLRAAADLLFLAWSARWGAPPCFS